MSGQRANRSGPLSRRKFVALLAAGSAAALTHPADAVAAAAAATRRKPAVKAAGKPAAPAGPALRAGTPSAEQKEFDRQRANTLAALKTIREYVLPPGGDLPVVFHPLRSTRRGR